MKNKDILLGRGLEAIQFGCSKDDVEQVLGDPDHVESFEDEELESGESHVFQYDEYGLSFTFDESEQFKLSMIGTQSDKFLLRDLIRTGMKKQAVLDALEELTFFDYTTEDMSSIEEPNQEMVAVDDKSLYLWFVNDVLSEIQWFPLYDEDDEIIWP